MLPQTKNGEARIVYLNKLAQAALASLPREDTKPTDLVFAGESITPENVSLAFLRACRSVKISDFRFHDLRHTAASWMRMNGADIHTVALILGHKDLRMAARYQHLSPAFPLGCRHAARRRFCRTQRSAGRRTRRRARRQEKGVIGQFGVFEEHREERWARMCSKGNKTIIKRGQSAKTPS